jgi:enediyne biosynthesis protein E4
MSSPQRARRAWLLLAPWLCLAGCDSKKNSADVVSSRPSTATPAAANPGTAIRFRDVAESAKIDFRQISGMTPQKLNPTANGSGAAVFDYDGDGKMDLYLVTTNMLPLAAKPEGRNRLFRNKGDGTFEDVTDRAGVGFRGFCHGVVAGDLDNDGDADLILCNYGPNVLYLNNGDGTFKEVTKAAGLDRATVADGTSPNWSAGGALLDIDNDGDLDLYIANYADWSYERDKDKDCYNRNGELGNKKVRLYCGPTKLPKTRHDLYRNDGLKDGVPHFTDVTKEAGVARTDGHGFAAVAVDLNGDGLIDLNVANDQCPAFTFLGLGGGKFKDVTESSGAARDDKGQALSGMGVDAEDLDGDGLPELLRTHFSKEYNTIHQNLGGGYFEDRAASYGVNMDSMPWVGWGCVLTDFDNDGWPDAFVTNGHTDDNYHLLGRMDEPFEQPPLLHRNVPYKKGRKLVLVNATAGPYFTSNHVGRGVAQGDLNDDGRMDLIVNHIDNRPAVLLNETESGNHWVRLKLRGTKSNRDAIGARVEVHVPGRAPIYRQKKGGGSLASSHDPRLLIGIGKAEEADKIVVKWPSGGPDTVLEHVKSGSTVEVVEGAAK